MCRIRLKSWFDSCACNDQHHTAGRALSCSACSQWWHQVSSSSSVSVLQTAVSLQPTSQSTSCCLQACILTLSLSALLQASWTSALAFSLGAALPLLSGAFIQQWQVRIAAVVLVSALTLCFFGALGAHLGGANRAKGALRVFVGGSIAMAATYGIGAAFSAITGGPVTTV